MTTFEYIQLALIIQACCLGFIAVKVVENMNKLPDGRF